MAERPKLMEFKATKLRPLSVPPLRAGSPLRARRVMTPALTVIELFAAMSLRMAGPLPTLIVTAPSEYMFWR